MAYMWCAGLPRYWGWDLHQSASGGRWVRRDVGLQPEAQWWRARQDPEQRQDPAWSAQWSQDVTCPPPHLAVSARSWARTCTISLHPYIYRRSLLYNEGYRSCSQSCCYLLVIRCHCRRVFWLVICSLGHWRSRHELSSFSHQVVYAQPQLVRATFSTSN